MANEISTSVSITYSKGELSGSVTASKQITLNGTRKSGNVQDIGTSAHEALGIGADIGTLGWAYFKNLDASNYVELGKDSGGSFINLVRLNAGEFALFRLSQIATNALYAKANTGTVKLLFEILED